MARPKKTDPFDFNAQFPNLNNIHAVLKEAYSEDALYEKARDIIKADRVGNPSAHYWIWPKIESVEAGVHPRSYLSPYDWGSMLGIIVGHGDSAIEAFHTKFVAWYDGNTVAQELYKHIAKKAWSFRDNCDRYVNCNYNRYYGQGTEAEAAKEAAEKYRDHPLNAFNFALLAYSQEGRQYAEINREQKYAEGDIVVLRAPFVGNHRYDPHWRNSEMKAEDLRYGTVMLADTSKFNYRSRGGKGSRLINVMWMGTESVETVEVPERCLKWESRKRS